MLSLAAGLGPAAHSTVTISSLAGTLEEGFTFDGMRTRHVCGASADAGMAS